MSFYILRGFIITCQNVKCQKIYSVWHKSLQLLGGGLGESGKPKEMCHPCASLAKVNLKGRMLRLPPFLEMHYRQIVKQDGFAAQVILSQRIAQLNMSNKRNRIGLKSSLFSSLCSEPEDSPSDLLPSYQGTIQQLSLGVSVLKLWQVVLLSFSI